MTQTASHTTAPCYHLTNPTTHRMALAKYGYCRACNDTGVVLVCNGCGIIGCGGNCACTYCFGEQVITCENDDCDEGHLIDADGDPTDIQCPACKGNGKVACPKC